MVRPYVLPNSGAISFLGLVVSVIGSPFASTSGSKNLFNSSGLRSRRVFATSPKPLLLFFASEYFFTFSLTGVVVFSTLLFASSNIISWSVVVRLRVSLFFIVLFGFIFGFIFGVLTGSSNSEAASASTVTSVPSQISSSNQVILFCFCCAASTGTPSAASNLDCISLTF